MVDHQSHGYRNIFVPEQADRLPDTVLVYLKILLAQIGSEPAFRIAHGSVQQHQVDVYGNPEGLHSLGFGIARDTGHQEQREG